MTTWTICIKLISEMWETFLLCEPLHDEGSLAAKPILWCCQ